MPEQDPTHTRILDGAQQLFFRYGIRSISMDEIARHLGMSKKTLYQHFENKDELLYQIAQKHMSEDCIRWEAWQDTHKDRSALEHMMMVTAMIRKELSEHNPILIHELKRFHPRVWKLFDEQRESLFEKSIMENMQKGIAEGSYRPDLNLKIMTRFRFVMVTLAVDPDIFPPSDFDFTVVQDQLLEHFVRGLLTEQGAQQWEQLKRHAPGSFTPIKPATA